MGNYWKLPEDLWKEDEEVMEIGWPILGSTIIRWSTNHGGLRPHQTECR